MRTTPAPTDAQLAMRAQFDAVMAKGMLPGQVANIVFNGIRDQQLYIQTHEHFNDRIQTRAEDIIQGRNPDPKLYQWLD